MKVKADISKWRMNSKNSVETAEGFTIEKLQLQEMCEFYKIPATLVNVDEKFGTHTMLDVLKKQTASVDYLVDRETEKVQVLDPKSVWVDDDEFLELAKKTIPNFDESNVKRNGFNLRYVSEVEDLSTDSFMGDIFKRSGELHRLPQGGIQLKAALLRLACTNGMVVKDAQYNQLLRNGLMSQAHVDAHLQAINNLDLDTYFRNLFLKDGQMIEASVADYLNMKQCLATITGDKEITDLLFPTEIIENHYSAQGIDITKINRNLLGRLPAGLPYYKVFNILTHGAKSAEKTLKNEMAVAQFCTRSKMAALKDTDISFHGRPVFDDHVILQRMGDL